MATMRRIGAPLQGILVIQGNLANSYEKLGRLDEGLRLRGEVYSGHLNLFGEGHPMTLTQANNYATQLTSRGRREEAKALLRKTVPVAQRILGDNDELTLTMRKNYAVALWSDPAATLNDLRESVTMLEDMERIARCVLGGAHPLVVGIEGTLRAAQATLRAREDA